MAETELQTPLVQSKTQIFLRFLKFGCLAWGGPVAQIAMLKRELVEEEKWISREKFNRVLAVYQALPGPEAHEMCVYFGMLAGGRWGGFLAGLAFMLPGFILMLLLTGFYITFGMASGYALAVFAGFQAAVVAMVIAAVYKIGKHILLDEGRWLVALVSALAFFLEVHFMLILLAGALSYVLWQRKKALLSFILLVALVFYGGTTFSPPSPANFVKEQNQASGFQKGKLQEVFFTGLKGGLLTFGGAYTAIPMIEEDAVQQKTWMTHRQFLDGIALSGVLPAPLVIFSTFVGYFGAGWMGAVCITFVMFLPSFALTLIGHQVMEKFISHPTIHHFLDGISASMVGLIAVTAGSMGWMLWGKEISILICGVSLMTLLFYKNKFTIVYLLIAAGLCSLVANL